MANEMPTEGKLTEKRQNMPNDFQKAGDVLQASVMEDARKVYSEKVIERWLNPGNRGNLKNSEASQTAPGWLPTS